MVTENYSFTILKQWRVDFPIVTQKNCNSLRKMQKIRTQRKVLRPGLLLQHGRKKKDKKGYCKLRSQGNLREASEVFCRGEKTKSCCCQNDSLVASLRSP